MYEVYCDESRQDLFYNKNVINLNNMYMLIGGIIISRNKRIELKNKINSIKEKYDINKKTELKWNRVTISKIELYKEMIDIFINEDIKFRTIIIDSKKIDLKKYHKDSAELGFYKFYYQLLHNWLDKETINDYIVYTDIKTHKNINVLNTLKKCLNNKAKKEIIKNIYAIESHESVFLQLEDILMGMAAYKFNYGDKGKSLAKNELIKYFETQIGHKIKITTKDESKYNVFKINL